MFKELPEKQIISNTTYNDPLNKSFCKLCILWCCCREKILKSVSSEEIIGTEKPSFYTVVSNGFFQVIFCHYGVREKH